MDASNTPSTELPMLDINEPAAPAAAAMVASQTISADEVALYDRQIRLWGMEAQNRMRNAKVLLISIRSLANEVAKNLVLAGIGTLTVIDHEAVDEDDLGAQFFVSEEHVGMNRAEAAAPAIQRLNPRVPVHVDTENIRNKPTEFFQCFDIVIATDVDLDTMIFVNDVARVCECAFYAAASYGLYGFIFADLISHTFVVKRIKSNMKTEYKKETRTRTTIAATETKEGDTTWEFVSKQETYVPLSEAIKCTVDKTWRLRKKKAIPSVLPGVKALWKFQQQEGRLPEAKTDDYAKFTLLMTETNNELGLSRDLVSAPFIRSFVENSTAELSPVAAILGGVLAQDVINVLAKLEQPIQNLLVFDGDVSAAPVVVLAPQADE